MGGSAYHNFLQRTFEKKLLLKLEKK